MDGLQHCFIIFLMAISLDISLGKLITLNSSIYSVNLDSYP